MSQPSSEIYNFYDKTFRKLVAPQRNVINAFIRNFSAVEIAGRLTNGCVQGGKKHELSMDYETFFNTYKIILEISFVHTMK